MTDNKYKFYSKVLHADYIAFMCFVWLSEQTVAFALYITNRLVFITEVGSVYCAVRTESLYNTETFRSKGVSSRNKICILVYSCIFVFLHDLLYTTFISAPVNYT